MVCSDKDDSGDEPERLLKRDHCKRCQLNRRSECLVVFVCCSVFLRICLVVFMYVHVSNACSDS